MNRENIDSALTKAYVSTNELASLLKYSFDVIEELESKIDKLQISLSYFLSKDKNNSDVTSGDLLADSVNSVSGTDTEFKSGELVSSDSFSPETIKEKSK